MKLQIDVVTIFPDFFVSPFQTSILKRAQKEKHVKLVAHDLRDYTHDKRRTVDDKPFGGGAGMLMKPEPLFECIEDIRPKKKSAPKGWVVSLDPHGEPLTQELAKKLSKKKRLIMIAGHYEGIDHRVRENLVDQEISVGDFITMGGEAPALCLIEAVVRLIPGVLGNSESIKHESFYKGMLEYPQFTKPRVFRDWTVPEVLCSGHHKEIDAWREKEAIQWTKKVRPDLIKKRKVNK